MDISIIICTRNRARSLRETLNALARIRIPEDFRPELIVVDNGSDDETPGVVKEHGDRKMPLRCVCEKQRGVARARNRGLAEARGEIILFLDDDVRPCKEWIRGMCAPIVSGRAEAVAGGVQIAAHLLRPWMRETHRLLLSSTESIDPHSYGPNLLISANMALARRVLERVPRFDPELGPGAIGFCEDVLFGYQLVAAGYRIVGAPEFVVVHHFEPHRLSRDAFWNRMKLEALSDAYMTHHWKHLESTHPLPGLLRNYCRLLSFSPRRRSVWKYDEGMSIEELSIVSGLYSALGALRERRRPRNYSKYGLVRLLPPD